MNEKIKILPNQYLTFNLAEELYALNISSVREVLEFTEVVKVPKMPDFMTGVINLRGIVVPVLDLRLKFGLGDTEKTIDTCTIIVDITVDKNKTLLGILTDSVREVLVIEPTEIVPPPSIGNRLDTAFLKGMGKKNDTFILILDIENLFSMEELSMVHQVKETSPIEA
jgi:purine-binding chemotaxis protein CheW